MKEQILKYFFLLALCIFSFNSIIYSQWTQQTNGLQFWKQGNAIDACDSNIAVMAVDSILYKTVDAGNSWEKISYPSSVNETGTDVSVIDSSHFWVSTDAGRILSTSDGGINWSVQFYDTTKTQFMDYVKMFDINNGVAIGDAVGNNPFLFLTTADGGKNWVSANYNNFQGLWSENLWRSISFVSTKIGYFNGTYNLQLPKQLLKTTDNGKSWTNMNYNNYGFLIKFYNEKLGFVISTQGLPGFNFAFNRTKDGGNNWETLYPPSNDFQNYPSDLEFVPGNPSELWFANSVNLYFSTDTGRTWTAQKIYNGNLNGSEIVFTDNNHAWLLCDGGKVFYTSNNGGIITAVSPAVSNTPSEYLLKQNYPNPFNPSTTISFSIPKTSFVTIKVYDVLGREVTTLVNEEKSPGNYSVNFNASNLPSGVYLYRIQAGFYSVVKKMELLK